MIGVVRKRPLRRNTPHFITYKCDIIPDDINPILARYTTKEQLSLPEGFTLINEGKALHYERTVKIKTGKKDFTVYNKSR